MQGGDENGSFWVGNVRNLRAFIPTTPPLYENGVLGSGTTMRQTTKCHFGEFYSPTPGPIGEQWGSATIGITSMKVVVSKQKQIV